MARRPARRATATDDGPTWPILSCGESCALRAVAPAGTTPCPLYPAVRLVHARRSEPASITPGGRGAQESHLRGATARIDRCRGRGIPVPCRGRGSADRRRPRARRARVRARRGASRVARLGTVAANWRPGARRPSRASAGHRRVRCLGLRERGHRDADDSRRHADDLDSIRTHVRRPRARVPWALCLRGIAHLHHRPMDTHRPRGSTTSGRLAGAVVPRLTPANDGRGARSSCSARRARQRAGAGAPCDDRRRQSACARGAARPRCAARRGSRASPPIKALIESPIETLIARSRLPNEGLD